MFINHIDISRVRFFKDLHFEQTQYMGLIPQKKGFYMLQLSSTGVVTNLH